MPAPRATGVVVKDLLNLANPYHHGVPNQRMKLRCAVSNSRPTAVCRRVELAAAQAPLVAVMHTARNAAAAISINGLIAFVPEKLPQNLGVRSR